MNLIFYLFKHINIRAEKSKSLICWKRLKGWKRQILFTIRLLAKKYLISGDVLNPESKVSAQSHKNCFQTNFNFKRLKTFERKVPQRSYTAAFTMQKSDKGDLRRLESHDVKGVFFIPQSCIKDVKNGNI